jgi:hypothetical protein
MRYKNKYIQLKRDTYTYDTYTPEPVPEPEPEPQAKIPITNVYENKQNVHDEHIEHTTEQSITKFLANYNNVDSAKSTVDMVNDLNLSQEVKEIIMLYCSEVYSHKHSRLKVTFEQVARAVMSYIHTHESRTTLEAILSDEMIASKGKCFQGRLARLINTVSGYCPSVAIAISDNEQIANVISVCTKLVRTENPNLSPLEQIYKTKVLVREECVERGFGPNFIEMWLDYMDE